MAVMTSAGSTIAIATGLPATYDATGFAAVTPFVIVGEVTDIGEFGTEYNLVTHTALGQRQVKKYKGSFNNGSVQLQLARDVDNAGQTAMRLALASDASYTFNVTLQDGTDIFFTGKVMSYRTSVGNVDQITGAMATIEIDSEIVEVEPA